MEKNLEPKTVTCRCGNPIVMTEESDWCTKCVRKVYYHEKEQRSHRWDNMYIFGVIVVVITFLAYVFLELIVTPAV